MVADNTNELSENKDYIAYPIVIIGDVRYMRLVVRDHIRKNGYGYAKYMSGSSNVKLMEGIDDSIKMQWVVVDDDGGHVDLDEKEVFPKGTSLPTNIVLTKVE